LPTGIFERELPPVALADLARQVAGSLASLGDQELGAHSLEVVLEDRDAAAVALAPEVVDDDRGRGLGVVEQQLGDPGPVGIQQRGPVPTLVGGWLCERQQPVDGRAAHAEPVADLRLGALLSMKQPVDLGPLLHSEHSFLPPVGRLTEGLSKTGSCYGNAFSFRPARSVQFSPGVDNEGRAPV